MKVAGMLAPTTDVAALAEKAFVHLDGVSDQWLESLQVEKVAGGQVPPDQDIRLYAEMILSDTQESCCKAKPVVAVQKEISPELKRPWQTSRQSRKPDDGAPGSRCRW